ncbi:phosphoribosylformylglycinamidine synthase subunit PurQ [bacterium]|nr:phosphoribosylformylglycinamidine synthase subunit PurQ [bacterium]
MPAPKAIVLSGYGLNCEDESEFALKHNGAEVTIKHINDLIENPKALDEFQIMLIPGGFSFGDDTGSGNAYAHKLRNHLLEAVLGFVARDTLTIGICNGCQILARLGLVPGYEEAEKGKKIAVLHNSSNRYQCRWVDVAVSGSTSPWLRGIQRMHIPVAHGEGNMVMTPETLAFMNDNKLVGLRYINSDGTPANGAFPANPNGATEDIAAVTDVTGRVIAMMPHPERGMFFTQRDDWTKLKRQYHDAGKKLPVESDGMAIFRNAVSYFG